MTTTPSQQASRGGISFLGLLTVALVVLKATGYLPNLSWWLVFGPLWIPIAIVLVLIALFSAFIAVLSFIQDRRAKKAFRRLRNR